ncbi:hypothetical protein F130042H8_32470 [Enterocloster alcoholdehydrogenati]|uniref:Uncharacterized protein n=1 Tax=Enterocloster alcoholdehydrogenati TaxID=2547410 RepID=A0ABQ0B1Q0_9FIRM
MTVSLECNQPLPQGKKTPYMFSTWPELLDETLYLIFDYPYKYYTFKHFEV